MENYEGWLMRYADGALTREEREAVEAFLEVHPHLREELEEVAAVNVTPVVATMPGKERLLKKETAPFAWWRVAAAVALLAVVGSTLMVLNRKPADEQPLVAQNRGGERIKAIERIDTVEAIETIDAESIQSTPSIKYSPSIKPSLSIQSIKEEPQLVAQTEEPVVIVEEDKPTPTADTVVPEETMPKPEIKVTYGRVINDAHLAVNVWRDVFLAEN
ncbi:MAG: hypothetical protein IJ634_06550 [Bacteroidales bacterium]|nr:hypothetical protein [Bacteroidales bacterium]